MVGHYLRVQDAARLLDVSPATIRRYSLQGWLPAYRVGHGPGGHRRFLYADLQTLARRTGRFIPNEPEWDQGQSLTVDHLAQYLGLSVRYLLVSRMGFIRGGVELGGSSDLGTPNLFGA
jgi:excisionase family DNA binding protein